MKGLVLTVVLACSIIGCDNPPQVPLEVTNVVIYAPLPGSQMSAAYFLLHNHTEQPIVVSRISSSQFASVDIHETTLDDNVARMRKLEQLVVPANSTISLQEGGKHLMLMQPNAPLPLDSTVSIRVGYDDAGTLIINAPLRARFQLEAPN